MKIALCTPWLVRCGIYTYSRNLAEAIVKFGHEVKIVRLIRFGRKSPEYFRVLAESFPKDVDIFVISHEYGLFQGYEEIFYKTLKARYPKKPICTIAHATGVRRDSDAGVASMSDRVVVHNEYCARMFGYPEKTVIIPHGASSCETVEAEKAKKSFGIDPRIPIVGYCGFISEYKGIETLIESMIKVPRTGLLVAGGFHTEADTPYIAGLRQKSLDLLPSRCHWPGYIPDERLSAAYGAMDIVVYPSRFATESGALLMALSHGKAVLASRIAPFKEKEKLGALMTFKDVNDLSRKIKRLLKDEELRKSLEEGAREYVKSVEWSKIAGKHVELYESLVG